MKLRGSGKHTNRRRMSKYIAGFILILAGLTVVIAATIYYGLGRYNSTQLNDLNAEAQGPVTMPSVETETPKIHGALMPDGSFKPIRTAAIDIETYVGDQESAKSMPAPTASTPSVTVASQGIAPSSTAAPADVQTTEPVDATSPAAPAEPLDGAALIYAYNAIYPGYQIHPKYWDRPFSAGSDQYAYGAVLRPDGYVSVEPSQGMPRGTASDANHIRIPSIGVDSAVSNLAIIDIGDSRQYETPKHVVGRIPETSNPGELGNTWLFGHLESPIRGEGNVFQNLPEIPALVNSGDPVYVSILNEDGDEFLYQITATEVVHEDDLALYESDDSTITLVSCVPRLVYDHRLLVTGKLVGVKKAA